MEGMLLMALQGSRATVRQASMQNQLPASQDWTLDSWQLYFGRTDLILISQMRKLRLRS